jgi:hypothetical protein
VAGALQPDELGDVLEVLAKNVVLAFRDDRYVANTQGQQLFPAAGIIRNVDDDVVYLLFRKKLFRSEAAASPRLEKQYEFFVYGAHDGSWLIGRMQTNPTSAERQGKREKIKGKKWRKNASKALVPFSLLPFPLEPHV